MKRFFWTLLAGAATMTLLWAVGRGEVKAAPPAATITFYVSPTGRDTWSGALATPNRAKTDGPFATLEAAKAAVRQRVAAGLTQNVRVLVRGGTYYLPAGLTLGPKDGGTGRFSVTWAGYPNERAHLIGGARVTGWQLYKGSILRALLPTNAVAARQVFENGARRQLARTGAPGAYLRSEGPIKGQEQTAFTYAPGDLEPMEPAAWSADDARVFIWPGSNWFSADKPVAAVDPTARTITLGTDEGYPMKAGDRYFVYNVLTLLDAPGEAVVQASRKAVYLWPTAKTPLERQTIVVSTAPGLILVQGEPGRVVRNLHFENLNLDISNGDVVKMTGAENCSVRFCDIRNGQDRGVNLDGHVQRVTIYGCHIHENGWHGVSLTGIPADKLDPRNPQAGDVNKNNVVENCHIHHCGRLVGHGYGVEISQSGGNRVVHNLIHHMPRYGTTIKGQPVAGVDEEKRHEFLHERNNVLAYNEIHHVNLDSQDTGAMESWVPGRNNVYDHNRIHDVGNPRFDLQSGFYLDDATDYFTVTNNIVYNVRGGGGDQTVFVKGIGNKIENNVLVVRPDNVSAIRSLSMANERTDNHVYARNIITFEPLPPGGPPRPLGWGPGLANIHDPGKTVSWRVTIPESGDYAVFLRYAADNVGAASPMDNRTTLAADNGAPVPLTNLPNTGGWGDIAWSPKPSARLHLTRGQHTLTWTNVQGGGLNWDAFALTADPAWTPEVTEKTVTPAGKPLVVVQAEAYLEPAGMTPAAYGRAVYDFNNWSDDRVKTSDANLFFAPGKNEVLTVKGSPADGSWEKWRALAGGKYDTRSRVADPRFVNAARHDYRLRPDSPALRLGIRSIDTSVIGLKADFPARFPRN